MAPIRAAIFATLVGPVVLAGAEHDLRAQAQRPGVSAGGSLPAVGQIPRQVEISASRLPGEANQTVAR